MFLLEVCNGYLETPVALGSVGKICFGHVVISCLFLHKETTKDGSVFIDFVETGGFNRAMSAI